MMPAGSTTVVDRPDSRQVRHRVLAALAVGVCVLALELIYGVNLGDALVYAGYELLYVVVPGCLVYRALAGRPGGVLRQLAIGWALGYALEILAFMATAATGTRTLMVVYPLVVGLAAWGLATRRSHPADAPRSERELSTRFVWALAGVCIVALIYVGLAFFPVTRLPGTEAVGYFQDYPWAISIAGEAKHHWPIQDPSVSGEPFPYHYFVHIHLASASQVTGLELPVIFFRLWILPLVALLVLQLVVAGQSLVRSARAGLVAACLVLFVGELQMDTTDEFVSVIPFLGTFFIYLRDSPSFLLGLVMFLPLATLIGERMADRKGLGRPGDWILVGLLAIGASDAKIVLLPLLAGGLVLYAGWSWAAKRRVPLATWLALALVLLVFGTVYLLQYSGRSSGLSLDLTAGYELFKDMPAVALIRSELGDALSGLPGQEALLSAGSVIFGALGLLVAPLIGLVWVFRRQGLRLEEGQAWLLSLFGVGLAAFLFVSSPVGSQLYFFFTALMAGCVVSAHGLWLGWTTRSPFSVEQRRRFATLGIAWVLLLGVILFAPRVVDLFSGAGSQARTYMFWFGGLFVSLALLYLVARRWMGPTRWAAAALVSIAVILVGALDTPLKRIRPALRAASTDSGRVTPEVYEALEWIRDETPESAVIAVNNQLTELGPYEFDYGAFSERRVFLAGWGYSGQYLDQAPGTASSTTDNPYLERLALNEAAFARADAGALAALAEDYGVRYLVVDEVYGGEADTAALGRAATPVYAAPGISVYELR